MQFARLVPGQPTALRRRQLLLELLECASLACKGKDWHVLDLDPSAIGALGREPQLALRRPAVEGHVDRPLALVPIAARVCADDARRVHTKAGLLVDLPPDALSGTLSLVHESARQLPAPSVWLLATLEHEKSIVSLNERKCGHCRVRVVHEMPPLAPQTPTIRSARERQ